MKLAIVVVSLLALFSRPKSLHKHCLQFLLGVKKAPRETENNAYAKFWGDKQRALWYVTVFSGVDNTRLWLKSHCFPKIKINQRALFFNS